MVKHTQTIRRQQPLALKGFVRKNFRVNLLNQAEGKMLMPRAIQKLNYDLHYCWIVYKNKPVFHYNRKRQWSSMSKFILKHFFLKSHFINTLILILWLVDKCYDFYGSFGSISLMTYSNTIILLISNRFLRL